MPAYNRPTIYDMSMTSCREALSRFRLSNKDIEFVDQIEAQLNELVICSSPSDTHTAESLQSARVSILDGRDTDNYGCWVHYPWSKKLIHLLSEKDFIKVRTNRNQNKITRAEQQELQSKKIGLIGLSVGHSVAMTLALERVFGELRIADFDELALSNLNRIRSSVYNLGRSKTEITSREIAELDPYLNVVCFDKGITAENVDEFIEGLDIIIDECDSLDIKILIREKASTKKVPVVMETSDRGMLDVERYDKDQSIPILHGLVDDLDSEKLKNLSTVDKIPYIMAILEAEKISDRLKSSMLEIGKTISTWPQLGSDVTHGGGSTAIAVRKILLNEQVESGRYYIDPVQILTGSLT